MIITIVWVNKEKILYNFFSSLFLMGRVMASFKYLPVSWFSSKLLDIIFLISELWRMCRHSDYFNTFFSLLLQYSTWCDKGRAGVCNTVWCSLRMCSIGMMTAIRFGTNRSKHCLQIDINSRKIDNVGYILIYKLMTLQTDIKCLDRYA